MSSKQNDITTINGLFQEHYGLVVAVARWCAPSLEQADDIVQQVYVEFARCGAEGKLDVKKGVRSFLYHMTKRQTALVWRRQTARQKRFSSIAELSEFLTDSAGPESLKDHDEYEQLEKEVSLLNDCLEALSDKGREMIARHYFDGISIKQIAEEKNQSASAMRHFFCRIRLKLKQCIEKKQS